MAVGGLIVRSLGGLSGMAGTQIGALITRGLMMGAAIVGSLIQGMIQYRDSRRR